MKNNDVDLTKTTIFAIVEKRQRDELLDNLINDEKLLLNKNSKEQNDKYFDFNNFAYEIY